MAVRQANDYLASGEPVDLVLSNNITYTAVSDPAYENMFLRVGPNGFTALYRAPDQDITWTDTDTTNVALTATLTTVLSITPDEDLFTTDTTYQIVGTLDNTTNQDRVATIRAFIDGVATVTPIYINLTKGQLGYSFLISNILANDIPSTPANKVIDIRFSGDGLDLRGDLNASVFKLIKAQAAPVAAITAQDVQDHDYKLNLTTTTNLGPKLSRTEIETVIVASGYPLPFDTVSFEISDPNRDFFVTYNVDKDKYVYVVLEEAT